MNEQQHNSQLSTEQNDTPNNPQETVFVDDKPKEQKSEKTDHDHTVMDSQHKRSDWFDRKIAVWNLNGDQKKEIADVVISDTETHLEYRSQMFLSSAIAALGLLINATPVVIGAMLIAPILRPIQGVAFASTTGNRGLFFRSMWILLTSIGLGIVTSLFFTWLLPLGEVTNEIAIRTQPTLVDLGIAFGSGVVAFLAFGWKKMAAGLAGVAMAASLVPPLAVIGIGFGFGNLDIAIGSSVLFMTNLVAIIIAGIIIFYLFGFYPTQKRDLTRSLINASFAVVILGILIIPLGSSLIMISQNTALANNIKASTNEFFMMIDERIDLENLTLERHQGEQTISVIVKVPQEIVPFIDSQQQETLTKLLAQQLQGSLQLELVMIPVTSVSQTDTQQQSDEDLIIKHSEQFVKALYHDAVYILDIRYVAEPQRLVVATLYGDKPFDKQQFKQNYTNYLQESFGELESVLINRQTSYQEGLPKSQQQERTEYLRESFTNFFTQSYLQNLLLSYEQEEGIMNITLRVSTSLTQELMTVKIQERQDGLNELYPNDLVSITTYVDYLSELK